MKDSRIHMVADHAIRPQAEDVIFGLAARAAQAVEAHGKDAVINATIGTLLEDDGSLVAFKTVYNTLKELGNSEIASYADLPGEPAFLEAAVKAAFGSYKPEGIVRAVATPGGTGAIRHSIANFTNPGDTVITANWYWQPYQTICDESGRKLDNYNLFTPEGQFDYNSFEECFLKHLNKQKRILAIFNTPAHNPTGFTMSDAEWEKVLKLIRTCAEDGENRIVILCDIAYIDFAGENARSFMPQFSGLPENCLALFAYSASKSYTMYGLRNGAIICVTPSEEIASEFFYSCAFSNRGIWSNGTRGAMAVIAKIYGNEDLYNEVESERNHYRALLKVRGDAFMNAAKEAGIPLTNYCGGFFVSVPYSNPRELCDKLIEDNVYTVPLQKGIRLAICATNEEKSAKMPFAIKKALEELKK